MVKRYWTQQCSAMTLLWPCTSNVHINRPCIKSDTMTTKCLVTFTRQLRASIYQLLCEGHCQIPPSHYLIDWRPLANGNPTVISGTRVMYVFSVNVVDRLRKVFNTEDRLTLAWACETRVGSVATRTLEWKVKIHQHLLNQSWLNFKNVFVVLINIEYLSDDTKIKFIYCGLLD